MRSFLRAVSVVGVIVGLVITADSVAYAVDATVMDAPPRGGVSFLPAPSQR